MNQFLQKEFWTKLLNAAKGDAPSGKLKFSFEELRNLYDVLHKNPVVNEGNRALVVETIRSIAEFMIWGDQNEPKIFEFFLENNIMAYLHKVLEQPANRSGDVAKQVLQTLSIIIQNVRSETGIFFLFSNNHVNNIVEIRFDFEDEEVLGFYISFLKAISLKLNNKTVHFFIEEHDGILRFPLYTQAISLAHHKEGMVRAGVRTLTLNAFCVNDPYILTFVTTPPATNYFVDVAVYFAEQIKILDKRLVAAEGFGQQVLSSLDSQLAEVEDVIAYCSDVLDTGHSFLAHQLSQQLWVQVVGPHLLRPILEQQPPPPKQEGLAPPLGSGSFSAPNTPKNQQQLVRPACALYVLERMFQILRYKPLLHNILLALLSSSQPPVSSAPAKRADLLDLSSPGSTDHASPIHDASFTSMRPLQAPAPAAAQVPVPGAILFSSCREGLTALIRGTDHRIVSAALRMLVAVVKSQGLGAEVLYAMGLLPKDRAPGLSSACRSSKCPVAKLQVLLSQQPQQHVHEDASGVVGAVAVAGSWTFQYNTLWTPPERPALPVYAQHADAQPCEPSLLQSSPPQQHAVPSSGTSTTFDSASAAAVAADKAKGDHLDLLGDEMSTPGGSEAVPEESRGSLQGSPPHQAEQHQRQASSAACAETMDLLGFDADDHSSQGGAGPRPVPPPPPPPPPAPPPKPMDTTESPVPLFSLDDEEQELDEPTTSAALAAAAVVPAAALPALPVAAPTGPSPSRAEAGTTAGAETAKTADWSEPGAASATQPAAKAFVPPTTATPTGSVQNEVGAPVPAAGRATSETAGKRPPAAAPVSSPTAASIRPGDSKPQPVPGLATVASDASMISATSASPLPSPRPRPEKSTAVPSGAVAPSVVAPAAPASVAVPPAPAPAAAAPPTQAASSKSLEQDLLGLGLDEPSPSPRADQQGLQLQANQPAAAAAAAAAVQSQSSLLDDPLGALGGPSAKAGSGNSAAAQPSASSTNDVQAVAPVASALSTQEHPLVQEEASADADVSNPLPEAEAGPASEGLLPGAAPSAASPVQKEEEGWPCGQHSAAAALPQVGPDVDDLVDALMATLVMQLLPVPGLWNAAFLLSQLCPHASTADQQQQQNQVAWVFKVSPEQCETLHSALAKAATDVLEELGSMWCEAVFPLICMEWQLATDGIARPLLRASADVLIAGPSLYPPRPPSASSVAVGQPQAVAAATAVAQMMGLSVSAASALHVHHSVQRLVAVLQLLQLLRNGKSSPEPPLPSVPEMDQRHLDINEGQQVDFQPSAAIPCVVSFAPGQERRVYFSVAGVALTKLHDYLMDANAIQSAAARASVLHSSPAVVLADPAPTRLNAGIVLSVSPMLGADPVVDKNVGKWLHVHVRPSVRGLLRVLRGAPGRKGGVLGAMRQLADGHWVLAFPDAERAASARNLVEQNAARLRSLYAEMLGPVISPVGAADYW